MTGTMGLIPLLALAAFIIVGCEASERHEGQAALAKALTGVTVSLEQGLAAEYQWLVNTL